MWLENRGHLGQQFLAPAVAHKTINGKEKFFLYFANGGSGIGVLTSDSPCWSVEGRNR